MITTRPRGRRWTRRTRPGRAQSNFFSPKKTSFFAFSLTIYPILRFPSRREHDDVDREVRDLDDKISALERTLEQDFGEEEEYAPMRGQCFEVSDLVGFPYKL